MEENYYYSYDCAAYASDPVWVGTKRDHERSEGKLDAAVMEKRYRCAVDEKDDDSQSQQPRWKHVAAYAPSAGAKRGYEQSEIEAEQVDKRYKCNYWEDPACAMLLQDQGGRKAKAAAETNRLYRFIKEIDAYIASKGWTI